MSKKLILFLATLAINLASSVYAEDRSKRLNIGIFDCPPYISTKTQNFGYLAEISKRALEVEGYVVNYEVFPLKRAIYLAQEGYLDGVLGPYYDKLRTHYLAYSKPLKQVPVNFITSSKQPISSIEWSGLANLRLGIISGTSLIPHFKEQNFLIEVVDNNILNLKKLLLGRVELIIGSTEWILHDLKNNFPPGTVEEVTVLQPPYLMQHVYLTVSKKRPDYQEIIDRFNYRFQSLSLKNNDQVHKSDSLKLTDPSQ